MNDHVPMNAKRQMLYIILLGGLFAACCGEDHAAGPQGGATSYLVKAQAEPKVAWVYVEAIARLGDHEFCTVLKDLVELNAKAVAEGSPEYTLVLLNKASRLKVISREQLTMLVGIADPHDRAHQTLLTNMRDKVAK